MKLRHFPEWPEPEGQQKGQQEPGKANIKFRTAPDDREHLARAGER